MYSKSNWKKKPHYQDRKEKEEKIEGEKVKVGRKGLLIRRKKDEPVEILIRRFKKAVLKAGILQDFKKHTVYEKPGDAKRRRKKQEKKNWLRRQAEIERSRENR